MKFITISGSHRSVGKTTLARKISGLLNCPVIKIGHGDDKNKPEKLFHDSEEALRYMQTLSDSFVVIESSEILNDLTPDFSVFIESGRPAPKPYADTIKAKTALVLSNRQKVRYSQIQDSLAPLNLSTEKTEKLTEIIYEFYLSFLVFELDIKSKVWLEKNGETVFGFGKYKLLKTVETEKSLNKSAKKLGMSYRHAWAYIKSMEERLGTEILISIQEGNKKSGSKLSPLAYKLIEKYEKLLKESEALSF